jgi:hypothetical protein
VLACVTVPARWADGADGAGRALRSFRSSWTGIADLSLWALHSPLAGTSNGTGTAAWSRRTLCTYGTGRARFATRTDAAACGLSFSLVPVVQGGDARVIGSSPSKARTPSEDKTGDNAGGKAPTRSIHFDTPVMGRASWRLGAHRVERLNPSVDSGGATDACNWPELLRATVSSYD